jgi:hypothetical protein
MFELDEWLTEAEAAAEVDKSVRTLRQWRKRRIGPPYALFGRTVRYRKTSFIEHFRASEITPARERRSERSRVREDHPSHLSERRPARERLSDSYGPPASGPK